MDFKSEKTALFLHKKTSPVVASVLWAGLANVDSDISFRVLDAFSYAGNLEGYILHKKCETLAVALWIDEACEAYICRNLKRLDEADKEAVELYEKGYALIWYVSRTTLDILNILKVGGELPEYVSLAQLLELAGIKGEKPAFLFTDTKIDPCQAVTTYTTPYLELIHDAIVEHWQGVDPKSREAPSNDVIRDWLKAEGKKRGFHVSANVAKVAATIMRHPDKPRGNTPLG